MEGDGERKDGNSGISKGETDYKFTRSMGTLQRGPGAEPLVGNILRQSPAKREPAWGGASEAEQSDSSVTSIFCKYLNP